MKLGKLIFAILLAAVVAATVMLFLTGKLDLPGAGEAPAQDKAVLVNEVMRSNKEYIPDENGEYFDWVELYNPADAPLDISGWGLSDSPTRPSKWVVPSGAQIPAKGFLVVYCSGENRDGLYANFKLSAQESVTVWDSAGKFVDGASMISVQSAHSFGRLADALDQWSEFDTPSPGYANNEAGQQAYSASRSVSEAESANIGVHISEFMASNKTTIADIEGEYPDWIELYNSTDAPIELEGFCLSDDPSKPKKWAFPAATIPARGYLLVFCSGKADSPAVEGELHTSFALAAYNEWVVLSTPEGRQVDSIEYSEQVADQSYGRSAADFDSWEAFAKPTPGHPNTDAGYDDFVATQQLAQGPIVLSEVMLANSSFAKDEDNLFYDWIELKNTSGQTVDLYRYALSDNPKNPAKWRFPQGVELAPGEHIVVLCSGNNITDTKKKYLHTNFRLSADGEVVFLFAPEGTLSDRLNVRRLRPEMSYGRSDTQLLYYSEPTPEQENRGGYAAFAPKPSLTLQPGLYSGPQNTQVETADGVLTTYTLDGSEPTTNSTPYTGSIPITKTTSVRVCSFVDGLLPSDIETKTYIIDSPHSDQLSIVSLVSDPPNLFDPKTGIYVKGQNLSPDAEYPYTGANFWNEWERPVHVEVFDPSGNLQFSQDAIFRIFGAYSRGKDQKGLAVIARGAYGPSRFDYPIFENRSYDDPYKSFILRASGQDATVSLIRDIVMTSLVDGTTSLDVQAYRQSVLYLNGEYWGIYNIREKVTKYFLAQRHNLKDPENIDLLVGNGTAIVGSNADYKALLEYVKNHDLSKQDAYDYVASQIDIDNYIDYMVAEMYSSNTDTGNIKYWREKKPGAKWRWIFYDFCWGLQGPARDSIHYNTKPEGTGVSSMFSTALIRALLKNEGFKEKFVERFAYHLKNTFNSERVLATLEECEAAIRDEMPREVEKWNTAWSEVGGVRGWEKNVAAMKSFAEKRPGYLIYFMQKHFNISDSRAVELFGAKGTQPPA